MFRMKGKKGNTIIALTHANFWTDTCNSNHCSIASLVALVRSNSQWKHTDTKPNTKRTNLDFLSD